MDKGAGFILALAPQHWVEGVDPWLVNLGMEGEVNPFLAQPFYHPLLLIKLNIPYPKPSKHSNERVKIK